jgi:hypothetical protein
MHIKRVCESVKGEDNFAHSRTPSLPEMVKDGAHSRLPPYMVKDGAHSRLPPYMVKDMVKDGAHSRPPSWLSPEMVKDGHEHSVKVLASHASKYVCQSFPARSVLLLFRSSRLLPRPY